MDDVRELLRPATPQHEFPEDGCRNKLDDNNDDDDVGRSPSLESEDKDPHDISATSQSAARNSSDPTALSKLSHGKLHITNTNGESEDVDRPLSPSSGEKTLDTANSITRTGRGEDHVSSLSSRACPGTNEQVRSEDCHVVGTFNEDGSEVLELGTRTRANSNETSEVSDYILHLEKKDFYMVPSASGAPHKVLEDTAPKDNDVDVATQEEEPTPKGPDIMASWRGSIVDTPRNREAETQLPLTQKASRYSPRKAMTPASKRTPKRARGLKHISADTPGASPQIGTSLLRRESLRKKDSPSKKPNLRKSRSPMKRETLQRRDTLQEREILQKVIAEAAPDRDVEVIPHDDFETTLATSSAPAQVLEESLGMGSKTEPTAEVMMDGTEDALPALQDGDDKDLHRVLEAIEAYVSPGASAKTDTAFTVPIDEVDAKEAIDKANETIATMELEQATQAVEAIEEQTESPRRNTRSVARFSDDTSMLKEFLNRAQAKKAAKAPALKVPNLPQPQTSPRRSPRKVLGSHDDGTLSPQKSRDVANRPGTPPGKSKFESPDSDDADEMSAEFTSCRRSTRTRLPAPSKTAPGAPSFIPVRRADGTDPVVLQKSQAQELAMITRANTRRNKGQSKPPLLALLGLPAEIAEISVMTKARGKSAKSVAWSEKLASYQDAKEAEEAEGTRPKVRRMRGLGSANGTPAAKRATAVVGSSNGTPAPKRRGKVM